MIDMHAIIGKRDVVFITLDTLRYDVAANSLSNGWTPYLATLLPGGTWEERHSPASFTYAAHHAFFAGFLPTPVQPGLHQRLFAAKFPGSATTGPHTWVFPEATFVQGLAAIGYHTICIGGTGFFNLKTPLGRVLPNLFLEQHWHRRLGVTSRRSTEHQVALAVERLGNLPTNQRVCLFINISAIHQPNRSYFPGATKDSAASQSAALAYVDSQLPPLFTALKARGGCLAIICSDHGTAYGEDGYTGHRMAHPVVMTVPYAEMVIDP